MKTSLMIAGLLLGFAGAAGAQEKPCMADAARLCPDTEPGGGAQLQCLKMHKQELSPGCKEKVAKMKIKGMERHELEQQQQRQPPPAP